MLRKLHKLREEFPFELSSSAPDTRHGLFERQPRQLETELFNIQRRFQEESSQLEQALLSDIAITQASAVDSMLASRQYCSTVCRREWPVLGYGTRARSRHPYCDPIQYHRSHGPSLPI